MVGIKRGVEPQEVRQAARHTLFVEGSDSSIDPQALTFFPPQARVKSGRFCLTASTLSKHKTVKGI
jgi:hypothetical protein